jgi:hypothetical protein
MILEITYGLMKNLETTGFVSYYKDTIIFHEGMYLITID